MLISELKEILPCPDNPSETSSELDWYAVEEALNTKLPSQYKDYIQAYGTGIVGNYMNIYNPFSRLDMDNLIFQVDNKLNFLTRFREQNRQKLSDFRIFPEENGFFPIGDTTGFSLVLYKTHTIIEKWTISIMRGADHLYITDLTLFEFLRAFIHNSLSEELKEEIYHEPPITFVRKNR